MWWWSSQASHSLRELLGKPTARHHTRPIAGEPTVTRARPDYAPRASHASRGKVVELEVKVVAVWWWW